MPRPDESRLPEPLAFYRTWTTYGTWLPGDERGWVWHGHGAQSPSPLRKLEAALRMTEDACRLDRLQRRLVEATVIEHCELRGWKLFAVNCRSNHIHVVVAADRKPEEVRRQLKSWTTRWLKEFESLRFPERDTIREQWWTERGSRRYIHGLAGLEAVIRYVREGQDYPRQP